MLSHNMQRKEMPCKLRFAGALNFMKIIFKHYRFTFQLDKEVAVTLFQPYFLVYSKEKCMDMYTNVFMIRNKSFFDCVDGVTFGFVLLKICASTTEFK